MHDASIGNVLLGQGYNYMYIYVPFINQVSDKGKLICLIENINNYKHVIKRKKKKRIMYILIDWDWKRRNEETKMEIEKKKKKDYYDMIKKMLHMID